MRDARGADESARRYYETVDSGLPDAVVALFDPAAVYRRPGYEPMVGRRALLQFYGRDRVISEGRHSVAAIITDGSQHAAVEGRFVGVLRNGEQVDLGFADFFTFRNGLILDRATYFDAPAV